jgi:hypothetical protein
MFFQSLYQSAQNALFNYIGAQPPPEGQMVRYDSANQGWTNTTGATVDATGNATFGAIRTTNALLPLEYFPGGSLEHLSLSGVDNTYITSISSDPGWVGQIGFLMANSDLSIELFAGFDQSGNWSTPSQITGGVSTVNINNVAQSLDKFTYVRNVISTNITLTTAVAVVGARSDIVIENGINASRTVTFGTGFKTTGTLDTGTVSGKLFIISFISDGNFMIETNRTGAM